MSEQIQNTQANNKRIAKNTMLLYIRMLFMMAVSLYTSRVVLNTLGVEDFGIHNVVGGFVAMFSVLSGSLSSSISRFITFELGKGDKQRLGNVFSTGVNIQIGMSIIIILLAEAIGVWFLNTKMNIPVERLGSANWVFQCAIFTFVLGLLSVPYNAAIIAHEKMSAFAYISVIEVVLKLIIVYMLIISPFDRLITYAILLVLVSIVIRIIYGYYCKRHFEECTYHVVYDKSLLKSMTSFAGWNFLGNGAYLLNTQGVNILMNMYFGVAVNAARGLAVQVDSAVNQFVNNFTMAMSPQITKSYASGNLDYVYRLICSGSKYAYFIMFIFVVPVVLEAENLLSIWLVKVPEETSVFLRLVVLSSLTNVMANPMLTAIMATGDIKRYEIEVTMIGSLVFPFTWVAYLLGAPAYVTYIIFILIYLLLNFIRLISLKRLIKFPLLDFIYNILPRIGAVTICSFIIPMSVICLMPESLSRLFITSVLSIFWSIVCILYLGMDKVERTFVIGKVMPAIKRTLHI